MGVDIHLAAKTTRKRTEDELIDLNYRFEEANRGFGYETLPIKVSDYNDTYYKESGVYYYQVSTLLRYYGKGYERGPYPDIYAAIEWMRQNFPEAEILYGGDYGFIEETPVFSKEDQEELMAYWCKEGGLNYRGRLPEDPLFRRPCPIHKRIMAQFMWGGNKGGINCLACGHREETTDGGANWEVIKKENS